MLGRSKHAIADLRALLSCMKIALHLDLLAHSAATICRKPAEDRLRLAIGPAVGMIGVLGRNNEDY